MWEKEDLLIARVKNIDSHHSQFIYLNYHLLDLNEDTYEEIKEEMNGND